MSSLVDSILAHLACVEAQRLERATDADLRDRVHALKSYQQRRFAQTHADLLQDPRYGAKFFLEDLYGPQDFTQRDAQFARVIPALVRLFPTEIVRTVDLLASLHALSERLDTVMARHLPGPVVSASTYAAAWRLTGEPKARSQQIDLVLELGKQLDHYTRKRLLRQTLKLMRKPAQAAGLSDLQGFLERGFDTFAGMGGAQPFLAVVEARERRLAQLMFDEAAVTEAIGQLP